MKLVINHLEKIFFGLTLLLFVWSVHGVFTGLAENRTDFVSQVETAPPRQSLMPVEDAAMEYGAEALTLERLALASPAEADYSRLISGARIACSANPDHFIPVAPGEEFVVCPVCGTQQGSINHDVDQDGMPNQFEVAHGLNPGRADAFEDTDGDLFANIVELAAGTSPIDPKDHPSYEGTFWVAGVKEDRLNAIFYQYALIGGNDGNDGPKALLSLRTPEGEFNVQRIGDKIPLSDRPGDLLRLDAFEIIQRPPAQPGLAPRRFGVLTVTRLRDGKVWTLNRRRMPAQAVQIAEIRSTANPGWRAVLELNEGETFEFQSESYALKKIANADGKLVFTQANGRELHLSGKPSVQDLNRNAESLQTLARDLLEQDVRPSEVVRHLREAEFPAEEL